MMTLTKKVKRFGQATVGGSWVLLGAPDQQARDVAAAQCWELVLVIWVQ